MYMKDNPFYVLGVSTTTDKGNILDKVEDMELLNDGAKAQIISNSLLNPMKRLEAEIEWFPGLDDEEIEHILGRTSSDPEIYLSAVLDCCKYEDNPVTLINVIIMAFENMTSYDNDTRLMAQVVKEIAYEFEKIDCEELCILINTDRNFAGFPQIEDISLIETTLRKYKQDVVDAVKNILDKMISNEMVETLTIAISEITCDGQIQGPNIMYDIVDRYEIETQSFFTKADPIINEKINSIKDAALNGISDSEINKLVDDLIRFCKKWDAIAQPIQVAMQSKGLEHSTSMELALNIRNLSIFLFNECHHKTATEKLTNALSEIFAEVYSAKELADKDMRDLKKIDADIENEAIRYAQFMNYEHTEGILFKDRINITPDGIKYNNKIILFCDVWHCAFNFKSAKLKIILFDKTSKILEIEVEDRTAYLEIVNRVWNGIAHRIKANICECLKAGKFYEYTGYRGIVKIFDDCISLRSSSFAGSVKFNWCDVTVKSDNGQIIFLGKNNQFNAADYIDVSNIDALAFEQLIENAHNNGKYRLSD